MNLQDCIDFAKQNPACSVATVEGDQPRVRILQLDWADESGFYFTIMTPKDVSKQLHQNRKVEVCFFNHAENPMQARQMRLTGMIEFVTDPTATQRASELRARLAMMLRQTRGLDLASIIEVFRIPLGFPSSLQARAGAARYQLAVHHRLLRRPDAALSGD